VFFSKPVKLSYEVTDEIFKKVVLLHLQPHVRAWNSTAYRKYHSTTILSVLQGLLTKCDQKILSVLGLLHLSATFDTLNNAVLSRTLGVSEIERALCDCGRRFDVHTNTPWFWCSSWISPRTLYSQPLAVISTWWQKSDEWFHCISDNQWMHTKKTRDDATCMSVRLADIGGSSIPF